MRIAIIGHVTPGSNEIALPSNPIKAKTLVSGYNFTRVVTDDDLLVDHIAYLKKKKDIPADEPFSVWEMQLCAGLLLGGHLKRAGHEVKLINYIDSDNAAARFSEIKEWAPDILVVSTTFVLTRAHLCSIGKQVREALPDVFVIAGGHHIFTTLMYLSVEEKKAYLDDSQMDAFVEDSQGESALLEVCNQFPNDLKSIANLVWRDRNDIIHVNARQPEENDINVTAINLDNVAFNMSAVHLRTARSCSFKCAFCSYPTIAGPLSLMELDNAIATLRQARDMQLPAVFFVDDTFNVPRERFEALLDLMLAEKIQIPWYSFLRCQYVDEPLVAKMKETGCAGVFLGVESGSDKILKAMKKGAISKYYWDGIGWLKDHEITTVGSFLLGFPGETDETVLETRQFIDGSGLDYYFIQPFYYLHHTPVHKRADELGLKGEGLYWSHNTMDWKAANRHINDLFLNITGSVFVNPDYTLWEIAYLRTKGMSLDEIRAYRQEINALTARQMERFGLHETKVTSRAAS